VINGDPDSCISAAWVDMALLRGYRRLAWEVIPERPAGAPDTSRKSSLGPWDKTHDRQCLSLRYADRQRPWLLCHCRCHACGLVLSWSPTLRSAITIGFIGGLTTYSSFNYETNRLLEEGAHGAAALNATATHLGSVCHRVVRGARREASAAPVGGRDASTRGQPSLSTIT
jgi:hypothetical protein